MPYVEAHPDALGGFAQEKKEYTLNVVIPDKWKEKIPKEHLEVIHDVLAQDPRPAYQNDPDRVYGMEYLNLDIRFQIDGEKLIVCEICENKG